MTATEAHSDTVLTLGYIAQYPEMGRELLPRIPEDLRAVAEGLVTGRLPAPVAPEHEVLFRSLLAWAGREEDVPAMAAR